MLKLRDISLKKRILLTNFLMIALPVGFLLVLGGLLFAGLKTTGTIREAELALLWQDKREALSIQLAISSLKAKADRGKKVSEMEADCRALERWGIDSLIAKNGEIVYASPGADPQELLQDVQILAGGSRSFLRWDERGLALLYRAEKTRTVVIARGLIPFHARAPKEEDPLHDVWEILAYIFLAAMAIVITALGRYLARLLSEQILSPLEKLKTAAEEIRRGNLDASPAIDALLRGESRHCLQQGQALRPHLGHGRPRRHSNRHGSHQPHPRKDRAEPRHARLYRNRLGRRLPLPQRRAQGLKSYGSLSIVDSCCVCRLTDRYIFVIVYIKRYKIKYIYPKKGRTL